MLLVRLQKDLPAAGRAPGIPDDWPAEVEEVEDGTPDPADGRLVMLSDAELGAYKASKQAAYDAWAASATLPSVKEKRFKDIDARTQALIAQGFSYASRYFSLSASAQQTWTGLYAIRNEAQLQYPVKVNTLDDADTYELEDASDVTAFYLTAVATYRAHLDSGTALKDLVREAATADEVNEVEDNR